jgi:hypothetical protein
LSCYNNKWNLQFRQYMKEEYEVEERIKGVKDYYAREREIKQLKRNARNLLGIQKTFHRGPLPEDIVNVVASFISGFNYRLEDQLNHLKGLVQ